MVEITRFQTLLKAVNKLGATQSDDLLPESVRKGTADLDPDQIVFGKSGLFYVDANGVVVRVVVHIAEGSMRHFKSVSRYDIKRHGVTSDKGIKDLHRYHLFNCSTLEEARLNGWRDKYKLSRRGDGSFFYRFLSGNKVVKEYTNQRLFVCKNCLKKGQSLFRGVTNFNSRGWPSFNLEAYLTLKIPYELDDNEFGAAENSLPSLYPNDWDKISRKFKENIGWICQNRNCKSPNLNKSKLRKYLHVHHKNMNKSDGSYINLVAYCIRCHADQHNHGHMKVLPDYKQYLRVVVE